MFFNNLDNSQLEIQSDNSEFIAIVRLSKNIYLLSLLSVWLVGWVVLGGYVNLSMIRSGGQFLNSSNLFWLIFWLVALLSSVYTWLWNLFGEEGIKGNRQVWLITHRSFGT